MNREDFNKAIEILTSHHSNDIIINYVPEDGHVGDMINGNPTIHIVECVPAVINKLVALKYRLSAVKDIGIHVTK